MKLRLRRSVLGNAQFGLAVGLALVSGFGCSDDDSVPDIPMFDGGADAAASVDTETTNGGGGTTEPDESTTETPTSETSDTDTLVVNPTDTGSSTSTSEPMPTSDVPTTDSTGVSSMPTSETSDPTSNPPLDTSETMDTASTSDTGSSSEEFPNLIANGGFESGSTGWNTWNGTTLTVSTAKARSGQQSLMGSGGTGTGPIATTITPIVPGGTYEVTFWASVGTGSASVRIVRSLACADNQYLWVVGNTTVSSTDWTELTGQFTVPDDCDSTSFQVYAEGSAAGVDLYVDDVSVTLLPSDDTSGTDTSGTDTSEMSTDVPDGGTDPVDPSTTGADVDSGVMDTSEMTEEWPDGGVDASSTEPVDTTDEVVTEPDASVTTDVMTSDDVTSTAEETTSAPDLYGDNIHTNPGFESGFDYWWYQSGDGTGVVNTTYANTGTYSFFSSGRTATWNGPTTDLLGGGVSPIVAEGASYHVQAWVRIAGTASAQVALSGRVTCDGVTTDPWLANGTVTDSGWTELSGDFTVPTCPGPGLTLFTVTVNNPAAGVDIYVDDFSVREILPI